MSAILSTGDGSAPVKCFPECPHCEAISGSCGFEYDDVLMRYFTEHPRAICPVYDDWRAEQMAELAPDLESTV